MLTETLHFMKVVVQSFLCYSLQELRLVCQKGMNTIKKTGLILTDPQYLQLLQGPGP